MYVNCFSVGYEHVFRIRTCFNHEHVRNLSMRDDPEEPHSARSRSAVTMRSLAPTIMFVFANMFVFAKMFVLDKHKYKSI